MSSAPAKWMCISFCMGTMSEYASHWVSLWKGTMFSQGWVGCEGMMEQGQASPMGMPSMIVRVAGQMGARPSIRTFQKVGRGTMGTEEA